MIGWCWVQRRWLEFRTGHGVYLSFILSFTNFILIFYNLLIAKVPFLQGIIGNMYLFALVGSAVYVPLAVVVGHFHNRKQLFIDNEIGSRANPVTLEVFERLDRLQRSVEELRR